MTALAAVVPLRRWDPTTNTDEWAFHGALDDRSGAPHTLGDAFDFLLRSWYARPEFSGKRRWTVERVRLLCQSWRMNDQPTVGNVIGWVEWLRTMYEPGTVYLYWATLRTVFELSAKAGYSRGNPAFPLHLTKPKGKPHHIANIGELWPRFLDACMNDRERAFLAVMRFAGLRRSEALGLMARDVLGGTEGAELLIRRQRVAPNAWGTKPTKGKRARNVPVHPELEAMLRAVIAEGPARVKVGRGGQRVVESEFLFPFREQDLQKLITRLREVDAAAFPAGRKAWHALRDTFAIELYENGADLSMVRDWLGHSTETVTRENYIGDVAERVDRASLRFVGAATPPRAGAPPGAVGPAAESGMAGARTPATPRRSTQQPNQAGEEATCSTTTTKRPSGSASAGTSTGATSPRATGRAADQTAPARSSPGRRQRALPGLAVGPVVRRPGRPSERMRETERVRP